MKRKIGRPRKERGRIMFSEFRRIGIAQAVYDEYRQEGEKHSIAIAEVVRFIRQHYPKMRVSEREVRRILAKHRPRRRKYTRILRFKRAVLGGRELARFQKKLKQLARLWKEKGLTTPLLNVKANKPITVYRFKFGKRPNYPRSNRKTK